MTNGFTIVKKGYDPNEVDSYINKLLLQLNEYKEKSSAINKAIINAQIAADNIVKEAHIQTENILNEAKENARNLQQSTLNQIAGIKTNISNQKRILREFQNDYDNFMKKYFSPINLEATDEIFSKLNKLENLIDDISITAEPLTLNQTLEETDKKNNIFDDDEYPSTTLSPDETAALLM